MAAQYVAALAARLPEDPRHHHGVALAEVFAATKPRGQAAVVLSYLTASTDASSYQILDEQGTVVGCSDGWLRIIGYTAAEALGRSSRHLHGPRTNFHAVQKVEEAMRRGEPAASRLSYYRRDGTTFENDFIVIPLRASNDNLFYVSIHERDPPLDWSLADAQPPSEVRLHLITPDASASRHGSERSGSSSSRDQRSDSSSNSARSGSESPPQASREMSFTDSMFPL